jgi:hypothetical protein
VGAGFIGPEMNTTFGVSLRKKKKSYMKNIIFSILKYKMTAEL